MEEVLKRVFDVRIPSWQIEIIAIDDASTDKTPEILKSFSDKLRIYRQEKNMGKGHAVRRGLEMASGDFMIIQDADLEYNPQDIVAFCAHVKDDNTIVYGSRNLYHEKRKGFLVQRYGTFFTTKLVNILYGSHLTDIWSCYKLFPARAKHLYSAGKFESDVVFIVRALRLGYGYIEHPISHTPRDVKEGKKIRYRDGLIAIVEILKDRFGHIRKSQDEKKAKNTFDIIVDPVKHQSLKRKGEYLTASGGERYRIDASGRPYLMPENSTSVFQEEHESGINWLKSFLKQFPRLYYAVWHFACPVLMLVNGPRKIRKFLPAGTPIIDVGSGPERLGEEFINVDIFPFPEVDIVADGAALPFADNSIPAVVSESVLEHVADPQIVASELVRVLKPGGYLYVSAPFIHPYHASPDDFNRWTKSGLKHLFKELEIVEYGVRSGPLSAMLMFLAYWLGVILSFGSEKVAPFITHALMVVMGPFKFLDFLFFWIPGSDAVAAHLYVIARKGVWN